MIHRRTNTDFTAYKPTTIKRRIQRRMVLLQIDSLAHYLAYLRDHLAEVEALHQDMLIGVTSFFRDVATFEALEHGIFPNLMATKAAGSPIRIWVPGCSTGEEVYSLAICLLEFLAEDSYESPSIQIFGTDLNAKAIEYARMGTYPPGVVSMLSPARLERFFLPITGGYQINKAVRTLCVFAQHNLLKDPPFSRIDLISCQNVLIYLGQAAQKKVWTTFHYALSPHGILLLGPSETIGTASDLFAPSREYKRQLYIRKANRSLIRGIGRTIISTPSENPDEEKNDMVHETREKKFDLQKETDRLLASFAPASVVVDEEMEILHFRGDTDPYLGPAPGRASLNLFKMARAGLDLELRTAISKAKKSGLPVKREGVRVNKNGVFSNITVQVIPVKASATESYFLILFENVSSSPTTTTASDEPQGSAAELKDQRIRDVERELESTRQEMRSIIEEFEAANEELHSANEESLSSNEELQSLNEELETSKEEIQASNEELLIINSELQQRSTELQEARDFADAIVETTREPLLVLDENLYIQSANQAFYQHFQVDPADTEHCRIFELGEGQWNNPELRTLLEELLPNNRSFEDYEVNHTFPQIGHRTLLLNAHHIDSVPRILLAMEDITARRQVEQVKQQALEQRTEFMAIASHELKTPVTSLKGYTQILLARFTKAGDEQSAAFLAKMNMQLDKLTALINELLDVTKIEAGQLAWQNEEFDLHTLVQDIVEEVGYTTKRHQIRIEEALPIIVQGNRERIGQVLTNLLTNAIKYSPKATTVQVQLSNGTESATVSVQDFGIGIAPEKLTHVFERFFRVSNSEHETFPGLGLGLFISAQIVKRHGGLMGVESLVGTGSTFSFTIPLRAPQEASTQRKDGEGLHA